MRSDPMRRPFLLILLLVQFFVGDASSIAAQESPPEVSVPGTELHEFRTVDGTLFDLYVALPEGYVADGSVQYPVFYLTDASTVFAGAVQMYRLLALGADDELPPLPPMILVGVDRARSSGVRIGMTRFFDLTPTSNAEFDEGLSAHFGTSARTGGADAFLRILKEEIIPWVEARYATGAQRGIGGYSLGGLFATYALFASPETFTHYWVGSPSYWWDDGITFQLEEAYSAEHDDLEAEVFMSAGSLEGMMVPDMLRLAETLKTRGYESLHIDTQVLDGESHLSGAFLSLSRGLGSLYRPR
jgi:predicted alpha/beta superfamily hydrolase